VKRIAEVKMEIGNWERVGGDQRTDNSDQEAGGADRRRENGDNKVLDEEVEGEEEETQDEEEGAEGKAALREAADGIEKAGGDYAEARLGARQIKGTDGFVAGQIAAEGGKFIFHPKGEFFAVAPEIEKAEKKYTIAEASEQTESRTRTPIKHGTSPPAGRPEYSKPLREW
jgi:hypothetical protein